MWEELGLEHSTTGLAIIVTPNGSSEFIKSYAIKSFNNCAKIVDNLKNLVKLHP